MDEVYKKENIYYFILNDQVITKKIIQERVKHLKTLLTQDRPASIPLLIIAINTEYDSESTHFALSTIFDDELVEFDGIPRKTAIFNHYRNDSKYENVRFFTDKLNAKDWLLEFT